MKYGKTKHGERWHALKDGVPLCVALPSTDRPMSAMTIVEVRDGEDPTVPRDDICGNCHEAFARKGRAVRKELTARARSRRDVYEPRHRLKE